MAGLCPWVSVLLLHFKVELSNLLYVAIYYLLDMPKPFPEWIQPMAATLTQERFNGPEWIFERKFDGIRLLAYKKGSRVELFSRNRLPQTIPALARAIAKLPHQELILDGEIDWHGPTAYHVFGLLNWCALSKLALLASLPLARTCLLSSLLAFSSIRRHV